MCKNSTVKTVVDSLVGNGFMFTAWDITKLVRRIDPSIRHSVVNDDVKSMHRNNEMPDYEKDTKDIGAKVAPFVYYHQNGDINLYQADWVENNPTQKGMLNDAPVSATGIVQPTPSTFGATPSAASHTPVTVKPPTGAVAMSKEGRINISPIITIHCGFNFNQPVWIKKDKDKLVINSAPCFKSSTCHKVTVNGDGRIRVCKSLLRQISPTATFFKINPSHTLGVANNASIEIKAA